MAAICQYFKWLGFQISDPIRNPDLFLTIRNPDQARISDPQFKVLENKHLETYKIEGLASMVPNFQKPNHLMTDLKKFGIWYSKFGFRAATVFCWNWFKNAVQWVSKSQACPVFEWSKLGWFSNDP